MRFSKDQIVTLSGYLSDVSKILFASTVIGFFIPTGDGVIPFSGFIAGLGATLLSLTASLKLIK